MDIKEWIKKDFWIILLCMITILICIITMINTERVVEKVNQHWFEEMKTCNCFCDNGNNYDFRINEMEMVDYDYKDFDKNT